MQCTKATQSVQVLLRMHHTNVKECDVMCIRIVQLISQVCVLRYLFLVVSTDLAMASDALGSLTTSCKMRP